jgi:hypothetical protein
VAYRVVGRRRPAIASWPLVRSWSLEGVATTPWLPTTPLVMPSTESGTLALRVLPCGVHSSSAWHWAIGNLRCGGSSFSLHRKIHRSLGAVLNDLHHHAWTRKTSKNLMPSPLPSAPNVGEEISGRVVQCTRPKS